MKIFFALILFCLSFSSFTDAQTFALSPGDTLQSVSFSPDNMVTLRCFAPKASLVRIGGTDIPEQFRSRPMARQSSGVWETTFGPLTPGSYRYLFAMDSLAVMDPRNPSVSESNAHSWSLFHLPGAEFQDLQPVPHGAIAEVYYFSSVLQRHRRMHVYTPPGYSADNRQYPVLYLLHGAFDSDDSWSTVGRAGIILDNLIASKKAVPMVVVMPAGHTGLFSFASMSRGDRDAFIDEFIRDIKPFAEKSYRLIDQPSHRAIAGLSMGGLQTLNIAVPHLQEYAHIGVFSSGIFELGGMSFGAVSEGTWESRHHAFLKNPEVRSSLQTLWFATGKEDFLLNVSRKTVDLFKKYTFHVEYVETDGGHTWENWREYLNEFAPLLFH